MGRQQYLERLALGRSPFQPRTEDIQQSATQNANQPAPTSPTLDSNSDRIPEHAFTAKGRPINNQTEARNAAQRNAQNAVLELVGVVESKDASDRREEERNRHLRKHWEALLEAENERGDDLNMGAEYAHRLLTWWPEALMARVMAGVYADWTRYPTFADVIESELSMLRERGLRGVLNVFLPGFLPHGICTLADALICGVLVEGIGRLQTYVGKSSNKRRKTRSKWLRAAAMVVSEVLCAAVGATLMPLEYHGESQRLGLSPASPILPHWRAFPPRASMSYHQYLWTPTPGLVRFPWLGSPGVWLILQRSLTRYQDEQTPILGQFTMWEYPPINKPLAWVSKPKAKRDPFAWLLYQGYLVRRRIMKALGWDLELVHKFPENPYQNNQLPCPPSRVHAEDSPISSDDDEERNEKYRSTALSMQTAKYLSERIDTFFQRLVQLPFEALVIRTVTQSYLRTSLPKTGLALTAASTTYLPFRGGPFASIVTHGSNSSSWGALGGYLSKLGLSLALYVSTEAVMFFIIYRTHRRQGIRNFGWGSEEPSQDVPPPPRIENIERMREIEA